MKKILISSCLMGHPVRYDGQSKKVRHSKIQQWEREGRLVLICPETLGGLPTPRPPAEIAPSCTAAQILKGTGKISTNRGADVTNAFVQGAAAASKIVLEQQIEFALLKANSPSCGNKLIYDGNFSAILRPGTGITAEALLQLGIKVFNETEIDQLAALIDGNP